MDSSMQHLVLGAFLHDIGKVMQRAEVPVTSETENFMGSSGPSRNGQSSHYHVQWTSQFFAEHSPDVGLPNAGSFDDHAAQIAFRHHNPSTVLQRIVTQADRLSSGMERGESHYERDVHKRKRLVPLRSLLTLQGEPAQPHPGLPLTPLTSKEATTYPLAGASQDNQSLVADYQKLWTAFLADWNNRQAHGFEPTLAFLDVLYERYFWCVPASTIDVIADNSLYEHSRTVAALAGALYQYHRENGSLNESAVKAEDRPPFLLVAGDLSGIQKYIFDIAHKQGRVAKRLRARSFILGLITAFLAQQILTEAGLPFLNQILSAGGKFYLLLPNTERIHALLSRIEHKTQAWLRDRFQGLLSLNLASVPVSGDDLMQKRIGEKFAEVSDALQCKKYQPLDTLLQREPGWREEAFLLPDFLIQTESPTGQYEFGQYGEEEEKIGRDLPHARCLAVYANEHEGEHALLGWSFTLASETREFSGMPLCLLSFDNRAESSLYHEAVPVHFDYRKMHVPTYRRGIDPEIDEAVAAETDEQYREGQILPFHLIAKTAQGRESVAYLKADVDNLGLLLRQGLEWHESGWTLSKLATFSRSMEFFFAGRVSNLLQQEYPMIYTVFSGGDDLLLVGPWNQVHDFARRLQREWTAFTGNNPHLTLSVGVSLARSMTPVGFAAEAAESALEAAKKSPDPVSPKNRFCAFQHTLKWSEVDAVFDEVESLSRWLEEKTVSVSFARSLLHFAYLAEQYRRHKVVEGLRYLPLLSYTLSRNIKADEIRRWAEKYKEADGDAIRHLGFVATYALNLNRGS